jgi:Chaperone of endosialidase
LSDTQGDSACYIGGIYNQFIDPASDTIVGIDANGKLGTAVPSSRRFKQDIKPMDKASEAILALKPVTFHYKSDAKNTPCFGLIAEEVAEVNPGLVVRNKNGEAWTVRYEQINAMLLNEFLKEHTAFLEEQSKVRKLEAALEAVNARLREQDAKIEKVSAQLEINKQARQVVLNNQ